MDLKHLLKINYFAKIDRASKIKLKDNDNITLMLTTKKIAYYWAENITPPEEAIHVIVEILVNTGRSVENQD
ncbi:767_t:CDS:2 [Funneliformis geosporum]|uniref:767_t:CDS:1 n=1 Tax=Funneliformis geosporum TaxID=1117311 RepID=A0A9W4SCD6_9GLOM|nr:767_t:CDS:2 [Funneliformis geosporum]